MLCPEVSGRREATLTKVGCLLSSPSIATLDSKCSTLIDRICEKVRAFGEPTGLSVVNLNYPRLRPNSHESLWRRLCPGGKEEQGTTSTNHNRSRVPIVQITVGKLADQSNAIYHKLLDKFFINLLKKYIEPVVKSLVCLNHLKYSLT
jgi:hypothetical protein